MSLNLSLLQIRRHTSNYCFRNSILISIFYSFISTKAQYHRKYYKRNILLHNNFVTVSVEFNVDVIRYRLKYVTTKKIQNHYNIGYIITFKSKHNIKYEKLEIARRS